MSSLEVYELRRLSVPGVLSFATHCEIVEIFANVAGGPPQNVFTIAVFGDHRDVAAPAILNKDRITVVGLEGWSFGIQRTVLRLDEFLSQLDAFAVGGAWRPSGEILATATLQPVSRQYVSADWSSKIPLNRVLKNNFWAGSHLFEWADAKKALFDPLFAKPQLLSDLSQEIVKHVPIDLSAVSDRLGNILVQLPVTIATVKIGRLPDRKFYRVTVGWHPKATLRPLRVVIGSDYDETVTGFTTETITNEVTDIAFADNMGAPTATLWDEAHLVIVATTPPLHFVEQIKFNLHPVGVSDPRTFEFVNRAGELKNFSVGLRGPVTASSVGALRQNPNGPFTAERLYQRATEESIKNKLFILYGTDVQDPEKQHQTALEDLRYLIRQHGEVGAWLWDPYMEATDVLETLFHSPYSGSDLRGLCSAENRSGLNNVEFIAAQQAAFDKVTGNFKGLKLEYRAAHTLPNINFHDRFLIFPRTDERARAWALGTSVNHVGKVHHILQEVTDGQRVADAFTRFWDRLGPAHLIRQWP